MAVLTVACVSIINDVVFVVIDDVVAINLVVLADSIADGVLVCSEDCWIVFISIFDGLLVYIFEFSLTRDRTCQSE